MEFSALPFAFTSGHGRPRPRLTVGSRFLTPEKDSKNNSRTAPLVFFKTEAYRHAAVQPPWQLSFVSGFVWVLLQSDAGRSREALGLNVRGFLEHMGLQGVCMYVYIYIYRIIWYIGFRVLACC